MAESRTAKAAGHIEEQTTLMRDLFLGFARIHVLYHASLEPIYGAGISAELESHGYHLSWGTLYPLLHNLESGDLLAREERVVGGKVRKYYRITTVGRHVLDEIRGKALELVQEITIERRAGQGGTQNRQAMAGRG